MALEGFTSASTGEQLFTLTGSVEGSLTGLLEITGTDLDLIDGITVTGTQYAAVEIGDLVNTGDAISAPISITSTANGGFTLQIGDAVVTVSVTYVQPQVRLTSSRIGSYSLDQSGNNYINAEASIPRSSLLAAKDTESSNWLYLNGNNLQLVESSSISVQYILQNANFQNVWLRQGTIAVQEQNATRLDVVGTATHDYATDQVITGGHYLIAFTIIGVTVNGFTQSYFTLSMGIT